MFDWAPDACGAPLRWPEHVLDMVVPHFASRAGQSAVTDWDGSFSYGELDVLSGAAAAGLAALGCAPGSTVVVRSSPSRSAIAALIAILRAGCGYVAIDTSFPPEKQRQLQAASAATLVITEPGATVAGGKERSIDLMTLARIGLDVENRAPRPLTLPRSAEHAVAYTQFTSGSTGTPKAVQVSVAALSYSTAARLAYYRAPVGAFLLCSSMSFDSSVASIFWTLSTGGHLIIPADNPSKIVQAAHAAQRFSATHILLIPSLYELLLSSHLRDRMTTLRTVVVAGEVYVNGIVSVEVERFSSDGSIDAREFSQKMNAAVNKSLKDCVKSLGRDDYIRLFELEPGATINLVDGSIAAKTFK